MEILFEVEFFQEGDDIVGHAKGLDVSSCGKSREEAEKALLEAVDLFLETCDDIGSLEEILRVSGFHKAGDEWSIPAATGDQWRISTERCRTTMSHAAISEL